MENLSNIILGTGNYINVKLGNRVSIIDDNDNIPTFKKLAPELEIYNSYKEKLYKLNELKKDISRLKEYLQYRKEIEDKFIKSYYDNRLKDLNVKKLLYELRGRFGKDIVFLSHENVDELTHRRLIADYIELEMGMYIPEVSIDNKGNVKKLLPIRYKDRLNKLRNKSGW